MMTRPRRGANDKEHEAQLRTYDRRIKVLYEHKKILCWYFANLTEMIDNEIRKTRATKKKLERREGKRA